ncbi:hypothetical protein B0H13DRAFT_876955 [Mycena leptocephala]|nr:hypothetical protein B0H13DRAFT_876955 [Mycena leptocephala]
MVRASHRGLVTELRPKCTAVLVLRGRAFWSRTFRRFEKTGNIGGTTTYFTRNCSRARKLERWWGVRAAKHMQVASLFLSFYLCTTLVHCSLRTQEMATSPPLNYDYCQRPFPHHFRIPTSVFDAEQGSPEDKSPGSPDVPQFHYPPDIEQGSTTLEVEYPPDIYKEESAGTIWMPAGDPSMRFALVMTIQDGIVIMIYPICSSSSTPTPATEGEITSRVCQSTSLSRSSSLSTAELQYPLDESAGTSLMTAGDPSMRSSSTPTPATECEITSGVCRPTRLSRSSSLSSLTDSVSSILPVTETKNARDDGTMAPHLPDSWKCPPDCGCDVSRSGKRFRWDVDG